MFSSLSFFSSEGKPDDETNDGGGGAADNGGVDADDFMRETDAPVVKPGHFSAAFSPEDTCLEGHLKMRKGRATGHGSVRWKDYFVHLDFKDDGSISVFAETHTDLSPKKLWERQPPKRSLVLFIPAYLPWVAKDVRNTLSTFAVEIPTNHTAGNRDLSDHSFRSSTNSDKSLDDEKKKAEKKAEDALLKEMSNARKQNKPIRIYFKCNKGSNEKALWLEGALFLGRFSDAHRKTSGVMSAISNGVRIGVHRGRARQRRHDVNHYANSPQFIEDESSSHNELFEAVNSGAAARVRQMVYGKPMKRNEANEYKAIPGYAYPHRWMTIRELHEEMMLPSTHFHDLRDPDKSDIEIGSLRVEVLQCVGLPRLDRASDTDGVVYMVCGPSAFVTDVIPDRTNPMWLRKTKRACIFPVYHGFARLYVGVFDDDGENAKDDFAGRVVVDIARLRHSSTYDVTLPLRLSSHVYMRRPRGSVRLRFTLEVKSEKDMMLSYLPKKLKVVTPGKSKPDLSTTIACADPTAFRNIAITIHSEDMPGHFNLTKTKAAIREMSFTIRYLLNTLRQSLKDTRTWENPFMSAFVFFAWMHCLWQDSFAYVPGYLSAYVVLQLTRTYAIYAVQRRVKEGFLAPTWEEMFKVLIRPRTATSIEPLDLRRTVGVTASLHGDDIVEMMQIKTHEPRFQFLFKLLGFIPWEEDPEKLKDDTHLEFPYSDGNLYPKYTLMECLADTQAADEEDVNEEGQFDDSFSSAISLESETPSVAIEKIAAVSSSISNATSGNKSPKKRNSIASVEEDEDDDHHFQESDDVNHDDSSDQDVAEEEVAAIVGPKDGTPGGGDGDVEAMAAAAAAAALERKEQDMDWRPAGKGKGEKLADMLKRISYKMHSLTLHTFHDHVYNITNASAVYFSRGKITGEKKRDDKKQEQKLNRKLDKLLDLKEYSGGGPLIARVGVLLEPMIGVFHAFLCFFRAAFNVTTWQDPYLTFWLYLALIILTVVLFLIPWRPILFVVGVLFVGPQNYLIRKLRDWGVLPPAKPRVRKEEPEAPEEPQLIFHGHQRVDGVSLPKPPPEVDPLEVQHIVVPYRRMMYQRFYDWPPELQYSTVTPKAKQPPILSHEVSVRGAMTTPGATRKSTPTKSGGRLPGPLRGMFRRFQKGKGGNSSGSGGGGGSPAKETIEEPPPIVQDLSLVLEVSPSAEASDDGHRPTPSSAASNNSNNNRQAMSTPNSTRTPRRGGSPRQSGASDTISITSSVHGATPTTPNSRGGSITRTSPGALSEATETTSLLGA